MLPLSEVQLHLRRAVVARDATGVLPLIVGGGDPEKRLAIHQRHYETSLVNALLGKFPATGWLIGTPFITEAARLFVQLSPPEAPCIAEYGEGFPKFLATRQGAERLPYLQWFTTLEWHLGHVAIAIDQPALSLGDLSRIEADTLTDATLMVQSGVRYMNAPWPIDDLIQIYLTEAAPDQFQLAQADVWLEIHGARGAFRINRLDEAEFAFRRAIQARQTIGAAAERAIEADANFNPGQCFAKLINGGIATAINEGQRKP
jgi:hypothetical protein